MPCIMPEGELLRRAVKWIGEQVQDQGCAPSPKVIEEACVRFNLGPKDQDALIRFLAENPVGESGPA